MNPRTLSLTLIVAGLIGYHVAFHLAAGTTSLRNTFRVETKPAPALPQAETVAPLAAPAKAPIAKSAQTKPAAVSAATSAPKKRPEPAREYDPTPRATPPTMDLRPQQPPPPRNNRSSREVVNDFLLN